MKFAVVVAFAAACVAASAVAYVAFPNERVTVVTKVVKPKPGMTAAQFKRVMSGVRTIEEKDTVDVEGHAWHCAMTDSTGSPDEPNPVWAIQWCVRTQGQPRAPGVPAMP